MMSPRILSLAVVFALAAAGCTSTTDSTDPGTSSSSTAGPPITAEPLPPIDEAPGMPVGLVVLSTADETIELAWEPSRDETVTGYELIRVSPSGRTERFETTDSSYTDPGLVDGEVYTYQVKAVGAAGLSDGSSAVSAKVGVDTNAPQAPGRPTIIESTDGITVSWEPVTDFSGIGGYILTRTLDGTTTDIDAGEATSYDDPLPAGKVVTYSVRAVDAAGNSSEQGRRATVLSGTSADRVIVVVSEKAEPADDPATARLERELLDAGYAITWFEDGVFDANVTSSDDLVLLLGDVEGPGFDWNIFATDASVIGLKSMFVQAGGITENPPKLDGLAQLDYVAPDKDGREVIVTTTPKPRPVVYIPENEQLPSLQTWARPVWSSDIAVAGLIPKGGELANEKPAPGCRAFFPGNPSSLGESTDDGWELLIEFIGDVSTVCIS